MTNAIQPLNFRDYCIEQGSIFEKNRTLRGQVKLLRQLFRQPVLNQDVIKVAALAARLYVIAEPTVQKKILFNVLSLRRTRIRFFRGMKINHCIHKKLENERPGSSGLTIQQLKTEKTLADWFPDPSNIPHYTVSSMWDSLQKKLTDKIE